MEKLPLRNDLAWAAGFYDGEGCCIRHSPTGRSKSYASIMISIGQVNKGPLSKFKLATGDYGSIHTDRRSERNWNQQDCYHLIVGKFEHVQYVMCQLWPNLCQPKRDQFTAVFKDFYAYRRANPSRVYARKLTGSDKKELLFLRHQGYTHKELSEMFEVSLQIVSATIKGATNDY